MKLKEGVRITGAKAELVIGLACADTVYKSLGYDLTVTAIIDGTHKDDSLHFAGCAADLRTRDVPVDKQPALLGAIKAALPTDFDVILEGDHIHLEWQPKKGYTQ